MRAVAFGQENSALAYENHAHTHLGPL